MGGKTEGQIMRVFWQKEWGVENLLFCKIRVSRKNISEKLTKKIIQISENNNVHFISILQKTMIEILYKIWDNQNIISIQRLLYLLYQGLLLLSDTVVLVSI